MDTCRNCCIQSGGIIPCLSKTEIRELVDLAQSSPGSFLVVVAYHQKNNEQIRLTLGNDFSGSPGLIEAAATGYAEIEREHEFILLGCYMAYETNGVRTISCAGIDSSYITISKDSAGIVSNITQQIHNANALKFIEHYHRQILNHK